MRLEQRFGETASQHWPDTVAYREAIQHPSVSLERTDLRTARVQLGRQGLPLSYSGRFAIVFRLTDEAGRNWALRCFTTPADSTGLSRHARYHLVSQHLSRLPDTFVPFRFLERGIRVAGRFYPAVAMQWAEGAPLGKWAENNRHQPQRLRRLAETLGRLLSTLEAAGIAHGDWQHDNLIVSEEGDRVVLVDYDAVFVPELRGYPSPELGHPNYQHPFRSERHFGVGLDRFSCLVLQTALRGMAGDASLGTRFGDGESLLFKASDFRDPERSRLVAELRALAELDGDEALAESLARLIDACKHGPESTLLPAITETEPQPIPLPEIGVYEAPPVVGTKWWQAGAESVGGRRQSQAAERFPFLERLLEPEMRTTEARHLWLHRALVAGLGGLLLFRVEAVAAGSWIDLLRLVTPMLWLGLAAGGGYREWPRRRIRDEIDQSIAKMQSLIAKRRAEIAARTQGMDPEAVHALRGTVADYVAMKMGKLSVDRVLVDHQQRINPAILSLLHAEGIETALDLRRRTTIAQVPPHQIAVLQAWCQEWEAEFAEDWRRKAATFHGDAAMIERWELETAEFERESIRLGHERERFPNASFGAYLRRLAGLPN